MLIASPQGTGFKVDRFERIPAKLGKGGMQKGILTSQAIQRGLEALRTHLETCRSWNVSQIKVTATSAVRSASNGSEFVQRVADELGLEIEVIDGDREAELIWKGVRVTGLLDEEPGLIMDIGGGSTEFIIADRTAVLWMKSYDLGVTRLAERFKATDPFMAEDEERMKKELRQDLKDLWIAMERFPSKRIIGASGSFNSISLMLSKGEEDKLHPVMEPINLDQYKQLSELIRFAGWDEREKIKGLVHDRVDTIPYSMLLIDLVLDMTGLLEMFRSSYALKEGVVGEMVGD